MTPQKVLRTYASKSGATGAASFFKTGKGEYGEGDVFIGVSVPNVRKVAKQFHDLPPKQIEKLLTSKIHEERLLALRILADRYLDEPVATYALYMKHRKHVNNWDLVDTSAPEISGPHAFNHPKALAQLKTLAQSRSLWDRRIAMVSMFYFIRQQRVKEPLEIAATLLKDEHDLIHKAVGWMLRELGKRADRKALDAFLAKHAHRMPRTALRYAIERHTPADRKKWLSKF